MPLSSIAWLSLKEGSLNRGNWIIEDCVYSLLGKPSVSLRLDAFQTVTNEQKELLCRQDTIIFPGATLLEPSENPAGASLGSHLAKAVTVGVAFNTAVDTVDLTIARMMRYPVGSRDPFTHDALQASGIQSNLVGCASLHLGNAMTWNYQPGPIVVSLGRGSQQSLEKCIRPCSELGDTILLRHVPETQPTLIRDCGVTHYDITASQQALYLYKNASVVVTSRLHALLPCVAYGTPVIFLGGWKDSRYSLVEWLGIECVMPHPATVRRKVAEALCGNMHSIACFARASQLREKMSEYISNLGLNFSTPSIQ